MSCYNSQKTKVISENNENQKINYKNNNTTTKFTVEI